MRLNKTVVLPKSGSFLCFTLWGVTRPKLTTWPSWGRLVRSSRLPAAVGSLISLSYFYSGMGHWLWWEWPFWLIWQCFCIKLFKERQVPWTHQWHGTTYPFHSGRNKSWWAIPFLDTLMMPQPDNSLTKTVYRKPTHTQICTCSGTVTTTWPLS